MMPTETIGLVIENTRNRLLCAIGAAAAGLCLPSASNQPIWPRRATITVTPGMVPLSISRLNASDMRCSRVDDSPSDSGFAKGREGVWGAAVRLAADCAFMVSPVSLLLVGVLEFWRRTPGLNRAMAGNGFALAIRASPMLETARIGGDAGSLQECSSIGRAPVSKTGGRRFEPCHSCQINQILSCRSSSTARQLEPANMRGPACHDFLTVGHEPTGGACTYLIACTDLPEKIGAGSIAGRSAAIWPA